MATKKIIGIDFGTYEIKVIKYNIREDVITSVDRIRRELQEENENTQDSNTDSKQEGELEEAPPSWHEELRELLSESIHSEIYLNAPDAISATLRLDVPFSDHQKVASVIPHLLADKLPLDAKHMVFDFLAFDSPSENASSPSEAVVGFSRKKEIQHFLEELKDLNIDPAMIAVPSLSLATYVATRYPTDDVVGYLDIGHESSTFTVLHKGHPILARSIRSGGDKITSLIAQRFGQTYSESEKIKQKFAAIVDKNDLSLNDQTRLVSATIVEGLAPILRDVRRSLQGIYSTSGTEISSILLCGGTSRIKNIERYFSSELSVKTRRFHSDLPDDDAGELVMVAALVECGKNEKTRANNPNLRQGELKYTGGGSVIRKRLIRFGIFAGIMIVFLVGIFILQKMAHEARRDAMKSVLAKESKKLFGKSTMSVKKVRAALSEGEVGAQSYIPKVSAYELLYELSHSVSTEVKLDLRRIEVDLPRKIMQFNGTTTDAQAVDRIVSDLRQIECLKKVTPGATRVKNDEAKFDIQIISGCS